MQLLPVLALVGCQSAWADTLTGRVVAIADGDTLTLLDADHRQHRIRLSGIDAPEKKQAFGQRSRAALSDLAFDKEVVAECGKRDRYRRLVCKVLVDGVDVNLEQVQTGLAWWYRKYAREQSPADRAAYEAAENDAKAQRRGLWADPDPVPPWQYRHPGR